MLFKNIGLVDENFEYRENMFIGTEGDTVRYIGTAAPEDESVFGEIYDGTGKVLMPGFYNAHGHSPMSLMRGYGENLQLNEWLFNRIFPFEDHLYGKGVYWGTLNTMAESIRFGIVSTSDMYFFTDSMVRAYTQSGAKGNISRCVSNPMNTPIKEHQGFKEAHDSIIMYDGWADGRIKIDVSAHAEYTTNEETLRALAEEAVKYDLPVHVHVAETESETEGCIERHGMTPVEWLNYCGMFDQPANAAHCVWLTDNDIAILEEKNVTVSSNPISNLKLVSGICEVDKLYKAGVNVAIGTDSSASNNSLNFFEEMKMFALLGKYRAGNPAAMTPAQVLHSATRAGAICQGRFDCGLVKEGYKADLIVVDMDQPHMQPIHNVLHNLVYSTDGKDVVLTMVDGKVLYQDGDFKTIDIEKTMAETNKSKDKILSMLAAE